MAQSTPRKVKIGIVGCGVVATAYYHESTRHLVDCILEERDPLINVEWGRHITEMMVGALESSRRGVRYEMTTTLTGLRMREGTA